jgi:hypothetical protein
MATNSCATPPPRPKTWMHHFRPETRVDGIPSQRFACTKNVLDSTCCCCWLSHAHCFLCRWWCNAFEIMRTGGSAARTRGTYSNRTSWLVASYHPTRQCKASHECTNDAVIPPWLYCLEPSAIQPRLGYVWLHPFQKLQKHLIGHRFRHTTKSRQRWKCCDGRTHETTWRLEKCVACTGDCIENCKKLQNELQENYAFFSNEMFFNLPS